MREWAETHREGTDMGPVDWTHPLAKDMPALWREAEANPHEFVFANESRWKPAQILRLCMYDGWPYWTPRPAIQFMGTLGPEWAFFDSYGVRATSIVRRADGLVSDNAIEVSS